MVDWHDPVVMYHTARAKLLLIHVCAGIYFWEFITNFWFDWKLVRGPARFKLGTFFYFGARYGCMVSFSIALAVTNIWYDDNPNCQAWNYASYTIAITSVAFASMLLAFRVIALSSNNKVVIWILVISWLGTFVFLGLAHSTQTSQYIAPLFTCAKMPSTEHRNIEYYQFAFDLLSLFMMMWYLHAMRRGLTVWKFMSQQGMIYFVVTTVAYLVSSVFVALHEQFGYAMSEMWKIPTLLCICICGTRMHRDLSEFLGSGTSTNHGNVNFNRSEVSASGRSRMHFGTSVGSTIVHPGGGWHKGESAVVSVGTVGDFDAEVDGLPMDKLRVVQLQPDTGATGKHYDV